ncbi:DUF2938 domain-containing protein [Pseudoprimorskyibacter insulae]|uniref:DUF2938 domain-containing protein n=1 Tax=Pseudoprimorskyibacter insulae TaxID=1695997 RepID=A0A2R8AQZ3_9RHOB|nr:DUF2938 domain-containing protein [Pseudoprimorskyibacter insulae]SPF78254.1 hypothetical protein PRI8871_00848 [Pseudoprimorskyibacter insulae]
MGLIWTGVLMGIGGTAAMDVWAMVLNKLAGQPKPNWANPGRWFAHLFRGRVFHDDIARSEPVSGELALGWAFHYLVGIIYGVVFVLLVGPGWLAEPTFLPVWIWGLLTIVGGWCLLHPGMGLGWFLSRTPRPWKGRAMGLVAHTVFALGMWAVALAV